MRDRPVATAGLPGSRAGIGWGSFIRRGAASEHIARFTVSRAQARPSAGALARGRAGSGRSSQF